MDSLLGISFLFLLALIVLPVIILVRISSIERKITDLEKTIKQQQGQVPPVGDTEIVQEKTVPEPPVVETKPVAQPEPVMPEVVIPEEAVIPEVVIEIEKEPEPIAEPEPVIETETPAVAAFTPEPAKQQRQSKISFTFENLLSKIGIVTLVLGIAFFVKYAIDKDWVNEVGRVAIGVFAGGAIVAIAHKLRKKYNLFSAILVGGGISIFYITITLAFREYELFNQTVAFAILIIITIFSVILSLLYNRKELALFSLLGGYASPLMISTGEGNFVVLFSFLLILNTGMLFISMRRKWSIIGIVSFICTMAFYWVWLTLSFNNQYAGAIIFAVLFFVQFYLLALFDHFLSGKNITPFQAFVILANNLSLFAACITVVRSAEYKIEGLITISMAVMNAIVMWWLFKRTNVDRKLIFLIVAIVLSFVSLAIPVQLNGHIITMFWAAEMVILLWLWLKSGIHVFYKGFVLIGVLTLISYFMDIHNNYFNYAELPVVFNRMFITGIVVIAAFVACRFLLRKTDNPDTSFISKTLSVGIVAITYLVPFFEIQYQLANCNLYINGFDVMILGAYTTIYVAVLGFIYKKFVETEVRVVYAMWGFVMLYVALILPFVVQARGSIFEQDYNTALFLTHYIALPGLIYIVYLLIKNFRLLPQESFVFCSWLLVIASVAFLSVEFSNTVVQLGATRENYSELLHDVHSFGYPILWGVLAMFLMLWGLRIKEVLLRKISLAFFAFIILKFYIWDIWLMSQTGRIISFVALGVILLLVSFLIQKIKILIKDDKDEHETDKE
ncbi:DUF2339 domain-containing protein [Bacteroides sp. 519]|uniref:DUF2339 domain-containing protein n=1 Tax=Bacteroides sp. 519 TaxID=2302937 RepID=UPI0013D64121|nr:DUF2339 domain-containing protein [Bacteroides sp. 519]NDV57191.1 DUF2339 domain-containing protein [Bacteroides sp. 519]